jgi:hypothetical protein
MHTRSSAYDSHKNLESFELQHPGIEGACYLDRSLLLSVGSVGPAVACQLMG